MKNSKEYGQKVLKLYSELKRKGPNVKKVGYDDPVDAMVYAIVSEHIRESTARSVLKRIQDHFVDLNDLRVSRTEEVLDVLADKGISEETVLALNKALNSVFYKFDGVSLLELTEMGKRQGRKCLEELEGVSRFVVNYCVLTTLGGHAIPLTPGMVEYLRDRELVNSSATEDDIEGFLERKITLAKAYEFYSLFRRKSETSRKKTSTADKDKPKSGQTDDKPEKKLKKKTTPKKKATKKTKKKKTTKKTKSQKS